MGNIFVVEVVDGVEEFEHYYRGLLLSKVYFFNNAVEKFAARAVLHYDMDILLIFINLVYFYYIRVVDFF